jgi:hypothetical protein
LQVHGGSSIRASGTVVTILLRIAAAYSAAWAVALAFPGLLPGVGGALDPVMRSFASGLACANLALAYLFYRASGDPAGHRGVLYAGLLVFGLRGVIGTYEVLYVLDGGVALIRLTDFVLSLALFVGMLNSLPNALLGDPKP